MRSSGERGRGDKHDITGLEDKVMRVRGQGDHSGGTVWRGWNIGEGGTHGSPTVGEVAQRPLDGAASLCRAWRVPSDLS